MAGSRNALENRGTTLVVKCPKCDSKTYIAVHAGVGDNGKFRHCSSCDFVAKAYKGDYKEYIYTHTKGK